MFYERSVVRRNEQRLKNGDIEASIVVVACQIIRYVGRSLVMKGLETEKEDLKVNTLFDRQPVQRD